MVLIVRQSGTILIAGVSGILSVRFKLRIDAK